MGKTKTRTVGEEEGLDPQSSNSPLFHVKSSPVPHEVGECLVGMEVDTGSGVPHVGSHL